MVRPVWQCPHAVATATRPTPSLVSPPVLGEVAAVRQVMQCLHVRVAAALLKSLGRVAAAPGRVAAAPGADAGRAAEVVNDRG